MPNAILYFSEIACDRAGFRLFAEKVLPGVLAPLRARRPGRRCLALRAGDGLAVIVGSEVGAVALLRWADADQSLIRAVADASPGKHGLRMPGTDIPIVSPARLADYRPAAVVLFLADLLPEVRAAFPEVEAAGGRWVVADALGSVPARG